CKRVENSPPSVISLRPLSDALERAFDLSDVFWESTVRVLLRRDAQGEWSRSERRSSGLQLRGVAATRSVVTFTTDVSCAGLDRALAPFGISAPKLAVRFPRARIDREDERRRRDAMEQRLTRGGLSRARVSIDLEATHRGTAHVRWSSARALS